MGSLPQVVNGSQAAQNALSATWYVFMPVRACEARKMLTEAYRGKYAPKRERSEQVSEQNIRNRVSPLPDGF